MREKLSHSKARVVLGVTCFIIGAFCWCGGSACQAQTTAIQPTELQEVVKLSKAQVTDDVIIGYISNLRTAFHLTADDLLYLKDQGVSQPVITALLQKAAVPPPLTNPAPVPTPQPAPVVAAPPPGPPAEIPPPLSPPTSPGPELNFQYFHDQLAPFGTWVEVEGVLYWRPDAALRANPDWRPYYDMGQWTLTDNGLFWQSEYTWGDIPFHYGRWVRHPVMGWLWAPDYTWGPAWVFWRHGEVDAAIGWAPLPVGAVFVDGGFMFNGVRVGVDYEFGLGEGVFVFVGCDHFHERFFRLRGREYAWHIHGERFHDFYRRSVVRNEFRRDEHGRFVNGGIGRERLERVTHGRVEHARFEERRPVGDRERLNAPKGEHPTGQPVAKPSATTAPTAPASRVFRPPATQNTAPATPKPAPGSAPKQSPKK